MNRSQDSPATAPRPRTLRLSVNDREHVVAVECSETLLAVLRERLHLTGTKRGCDLGECGCCTVLVDGEPVLSCLTLAVDVEVAEIITIEGVAADDGGLSPVQQAFVDEGAIQCGFCTPAMVINATHMLAENPNPDATAIKECVSGTICRCTGYTKVERAIAAAAGGDA